MSAKTLGRYEILGELGKGAMGLVYLAMDPLIGRKLALKTFRLGYSAADQDLEQFKARFLREAQSAGILNHPNIVTIHDVVVEEGGEFFIAMEYVEGTDLKILLQKERRFDIEFAIETVAQIADGLGYAHSNRVIHRDIKPANVIITRDQQAKITDFGIARVDASNLTVEGQLLGTPNYMAPEAIMGRDVDHRADLFSLGVMLYEMLTGKKPFRADNLTAVSHRIVYDDPQPVDEVIEDVPAAALEILDKALQKRPEDRYQSGTDMARDLRASLEEPAVPEPQKSSGSFLAAPSAMKQASATTQAAPSGEGSGDPPRPVDSVSSGGLDDHGSGALVSPIGRSAETGPTPSSAPKRKPLLIGAGAAALAIVAATVAILSVRSQSQEDSQEPLRPTVVETPSERDSLMTEGRRLLAAGEPAAAIGFFDRVVAVAPDDREARRLRDQADAARLSADESDPRLRAGRVALEARDYLDAKQIAEEILASDDGNKEAAALLAEARAGLERKEQVRSRLRGSTTPLAPTVTPRESPPRSSAKPPEQVERGTIAVDFFSEVSAGKLTIFSGQKRLYQQSFEFLEGASGVLRRRAPTSGRLSTELELESGNVSLLVYVYLKGSELKSTKVEGDLGANTTRTLRIRVSQDGRMSAKFDP